MKVAEAIEILKGFDPTAELFIPHDGWFLPVKKIESGIVTKAESIWCGPVSSFLGERWMQGVMENVSPENREWIQRQAREGKSAVGIM